MSSAGYLSPEPAQVKLYVQELRANGAAPFPPTPTGGGLTVSIEAATGRAISPSALHRRQWNFLCGPKVSALVSV